VRWEQAICKQPWESVEKFLTRLQPRALYDKSVERNDNEMNEKVTQGEGYTLATTEEEATSTKKICATIDGIPGETRGGMNPTIFKLPCPKQVVCSTNFEFFREEQKVWLGVKKENHIIHSEYKCQALREEWKRRVSIKMEYNDLLKNLKNLAHVYKMMDGKWIVFVEVEYINKFWEALLPMAIASSVVTAVRVNIDGCSEGKQEYARMIEKPKERRPVQPVNVYISNMGSNKELNEAALLLRKAGHMAEPGYKPKLSFKPTIFTILNIYKSNKYRLRPSIFTIPAGTDKILPIHYPNSEFKKLDE